MSTVDAHAHAHVAEREIAKSLDSLSEDLHKSEEANLPSPPPSAPVYPEGGWVAWLTVIGG